MRCESSNRKINEDDPCVFLGKENGTNYVFDSLLVDDHLTIFQEGLDKYGLSVKGYFSPLKALEEFLPAIYNVAIVNVTTDAMKGRDLSKNLAAVHTNSSLEII